MTVRNPATHRGMVLTEQEAFEHLAVLSLLQRFVDRCDVLPAGTEETEPEKRA